MAKSTKTEHWQTKPAKHDYPAATDFLTLLLSAEQAGAIVSALQKAPIIHRKAKDILRASSLPILSAENAEVSKDLAKVRTGTNLSPVLLVRGDVRRGHALIVADGYHRVCASYQLDEDAEIPCQMVDLPT